MIPNLTKPSSGLRRSKHTVVSCASLLLALASTRPALANEYVTVTSNDENVLKIEDIENNNFKVYGVVNSVEVQVVPALNFTLITNPKQTVGVQKDGEWAVRASDSMEDAASGGEGTITYCKINCVLSAEEALNVYTGDACEAKAIVTPLEFGDMVSYRLVNNRTEEEFGVGAEEISTGVYKLSIPGGEPDEYTLEAFIEDVILVSMSVRSIDGEWVSKANYSYNGINAAEFKKMGWMDKKVLPVETGSAGANSGGNAMKLGGSTPMDVPVGSFCEAELVFHNINDAQLLPRARNYPANSTFEGVFKKGNGTQPMVWKYKDDAMMPNIFSTNKIDTIGEINLSANVHYFWGDKEYNDRVFQARSNEEFDGVYVKELKVTDASGNEKKANDGVYYFLARSGLNSLGTVEAISSSESGFPPDVPNGFDKHLNPKWVILDKYKDKNGVEQSNTYYDRVLPGSSTADIRVRDGDETKITAYCGDSKMSAEFKRAYVDRIEVFCAHNGRGGSNYLEVVGKDTVKFKAIWNPIDPLGVDDYVPMWDVKPKENRHNYMTGNPISRGVENNYIYPIKRKYTATLFGKTGTVLCFASETNSISIDSSGITSVVGSITTVLGKITEPERFEKPSVFGSYTWWYEEHPETVFVERPWEFMLGCDPLIGFNLKYRFLKNHPLIKALDVAGIKAGPYVALSGKITAAVGVSKDVYGDVKLCDNEFGGEISLAVGAEISTGERFVLDINAKSTISSTGSFSCVDVSEEKTELYLNGNTNFGEFDINAKCIIRIGNGRRSRWIPDFSIEKTWTIWDGYQSPINELKVYSF